MLFRRRTHLGLAILFVFCTISGSAASLGPKPGDVYKEFYLNTGGGKGWRVTDPTCKRADAQKFLPNPIHDLTVSDLTDAIRAEVVIDRWGGHPNTRDKQIRFNNNAWIMLPELTTTPTSSIKYYSQDNPMAAVPLSHLQVGVNKVEGTCYSFGWGQWGMFAVMVRVYYDPSKKAHVTGSITSPSANGSMPNNPVIAVQTANNPSVKKVDVLGYYRDYDYDGDGFYQEWVEHWRQPVKDGTAVLAQHIGSDTAAPFQVTWNTDWLPDQDPGSVKLAARIQNTSDVFYVTNEVTGLSFNRNFAVRMYTATNVPEEFGVRNNPNNVKSCTVNIPSTEKLNLATAAKIYLRTWNGLDSHHQQPFKINTWSSPIGGLSHFYKLSEWAVPISALKNGNNTVSFSSSFPDHALEILWPGPAILIKTSQESAARTGRMYK